MSKSSLMGVGEASLEPEHHSQAFAHSKSVLRRADIANVRIDRCCSDLGESHEARKPIIFVLEGTRIGLLGCCPVGHPGCEATAHGTGHVLPCSHAHYEQWDPQSCTPPPDHPCGGKIVIHTATAAWGRTS